MVNTAWSIAGNFGYAACQWAILVIIAKRGTPQMVGQFTLGLAISAPIFLFSNLQIRAIQTTDLRAEFAFGDYLGLRIATVCFHF